MLRAELDALPVKEETGLSYASTATATTPDGRTVPVSHACGHDLHLACLAGAARRLAASDDWRGTVLVIGQPAEETLEGAAAMPADGLYERFGVPDVAPAQHVSPFPAGLIAYLEPPTAGLIACPEPPTAVGAELRVVVTGDGGHVGDVGQAVGCNPVAAVAALVHRLDQTAFDQAVVTVRDAARGRARERRPHPRRGGDHGQGRDGGRGDPGRRPRRAAGGGDGGSRRHRGLQGAARRERPRRHRPGTPGPRGRARHGRHRPRRHGLRGLPPLRRPFRLLVRKRWPGRTPAYRDFPPRSRAYVEGRGHRHANGCPGSPCEPVTVRPSIPISWTRSSSRALMKTVSASWSGKACPLCRAALTCRRGLGTLELRARL
ncbi:M20/M25/M40 family metallo-hydrolase [Nonomuraea sp. NPDC003709]|uniref:M20/M25/M40 family metallo-hydrolase n=1 Tax=Nonomuraea sp. NPDC003709 TaxID=3154450 RepID=UPI0033A3AA87